MRYATHRAGAAAAVLAIVAAGCGASPSEPDSAAAPEPTKTHSPSTRPTVPTIRPAGTGDPFADARTAADHMPMTAAALAQGFAQAAGVDGSTTSKAAELRSGLSYLLTEHVYLAGIAVATAYAKGADSPEFEAAAATLDANSKAVADAVGSVAGKDKGDQFLESWRSHIRDFVEYAVAAKSKDAAGKRSAVANLTAYAKSSGEFFAEITGGALPADAVRESFEMHIGSLATAVDGFAAGDKAAYDDLKAAAGHLSMSAQALAAGIDKAAKLPGDPDDAASELRASFTAALTEHVYLASIAVFTAYTAGADSAAFESAAAALDENSVEIAAAVGSQTDATTEKAFLQAWRQHVDDFVTYAVAAGGKDSAGKKTALADLAGYTASAGKLISEATDGALPADAVGASLVAHVRSLSGAIDSLAKALV